MIFSTDNGLPNDLKIGPIIGGGVTIAAGWRSVFWICAGYGVCLFSFLFLFFPETYRLDHQWDQSFTELQSQTTLVNISSLIVKPDNNKSNIAIHIPPESNKFL